MVIIAVPHATKSTRWYLENKHSNFRECLLQNEIPQGQGHCLFKTDALPEPKLQLSYLFCAGKTHRRFYNRCLQFIAQKQNVGKHVLHTNFNTLKSPNFTSPSNRQQLFGKAFLSHMSTEGLFTSSGATVLASVLSIRQKLHFKRLKFETKYIYIYYLPSFTCNVGHIHVFFVMHVHYPIWLLHF